MARLFELTIANTAARTLRAVCFLSLSSMIGATCSANNIPTPENTTSKPAAPVIQNNKTTQPTNAIKTPVKPAKPIWAELTPLQQQALAPLSSDWDKLDSLRKKKWLAFAKKFPSMKPEEQHRVQERMSEWAKLSPEQRRTARESYARAKKLNPDQKSAKWEQYQNLPEDQKKKLAAEADSKKRLANLPRPVNNKNKPQTASKIASKPLLEQPLAPQSVTPTSPQASTPSPTK